MNKLIITAHPSSQGFTHKIAEKLANLSEKQGQKVEILDLYKTDLKQDFLAFENIKEMGKDEVTKAMQAKITWADELVFVFPIWWGDTPAIMKNFIDCNFGAGFAFKFVDGKSIGLLPGKTARIIATSGAPSFLYTWVLHVQLMWNLNRIKFCGIKQKSFTVFGNMDKPGTNKDAYLKQVAALV